MKRINDKAININNSQLNFFKRIKLADGQTMKNIKNKTCSLFDSISKELSLLDSFNYSLIYKSNNHQNKEKNHNKSDKFLIKKIKLRDKNNILFNKKRKNSLFHFIKRNKEKKGNINKKENSTLLSRNSTLFNKNFQIFNKNIKEIKSNERKKIDSKQIKSKLFNNNINNNISENSEMLKSTNQSLSFNDNINKNLNLKSLISLSIISRRINIK